MGRGIFLRSVVKGETNIILILAQLPSFFKIMHSDQICDSSCIVHSVPNFVHAYNVHVVASMHSCQNIGSLCIVVVIHAYSPVTCILSLCIELQQLCVSLCIAASSVNLCIVVSA